MEAYLKTAAITAAMFTALVAATAFAAGEGPGAGTMMDSSMNKSTTAKGNPTISDEDRDNFSRDTTRKAPAHPPTPVRGNTGNTVSGSGTSAITGDTGTGGSRH